MRLLVFAKGGEARLGIRVGDRILDVGEAGIDAPADVADVLRSGPHLMDQLAQLSRNPASAVSLPLASAILLPPTVRSGKIICLGLNYQSHVAEVGVQQKPDYPTVFLRAASSLVGPCAPIVRPRVSQALDFEGELVAFIGRTGRHIPLERALDHAAGYAVFNDASVRDYQMRTTQWTMGKNFDGSGPFGPEFVSADELPPGATGLGIQTRLNGEIVQNANTSDMIFGVAETIALLSQCFTLEVGDLLVMGTPSGVGNAREPKLFMKPGDVCEVEVERVGLIRNSIVEEA